jgi:hypothetical protein
MSEDRKEVVVCGDGEGFSTKSSSDRTGWRRMSDQNREGLTGGPTPTIYCSRLWGRARR